MTRAMQIIGAEWKDSIARAKLGVNTFGAPFDKAESQIIDYINYLREKETSRIIYKSQDPQKHLREYIVEFILKTGHVEKCSWATVSSAVYMYDRFMDNHSVSKNQIHLVALSCLIIAGKVEEQEQNVRTIKHLKHYLPYWSEYNPRLYIDIECYVIGFFRWKLNMVTTHTFLECFILFAMEGTSFAVQTFPFPVLGENENQELEAIKCSCQSLPINITQDVPHNIRDYAFVVLSYIISAEPRDRHSPSVIAASCLQYARRRFGYNFWTQRLVDITGCSHLALVECLANYIESEVPNDFSFGGPLLEPVFMTE